jgi:hypothetical protein
MDRNNAGKSKMQASSPAAESMDSQTFSSSPLPTPSESSFGAENVEPQSMTTLTTPARSAVKPVTTPRSSRQKPLMEAATMKTPGMPIPTPQVAYSQAKGVYRKMSDSSGEHELSPDDRFSFHSTFELASHDDDEFLPDEFKATLQNSKSSTDRESSIPDRLYSSDQVQVIVNEALHQAHEEWQETIFMKAQDEYEQTIAKLRKEAETLLEEHGNLWIRQHEAELEETRTKMDDQMKQQTERHEQEKVDLQLQMTKYKEGEIEALQSTVSFITESSAKEREDLQKQIKELKAIVDDVQKQLAADTDLLRKELEQSEAKRLDLLGTQGDLEKSKEVCGTTKEESDDAQQLQLNEKIVGLELEHLRIIEDRDRQLQEMRDETAAEIQRVKDESMQLMENDRLSAEGAATVANGIEIDKRLSAMKLEHSQETYQQLNALKLEHSQEIDQRLLTMKQQHSQEINRLKTDADLRVAQFQRETEIEYEALKSELKSISGIEWSKEKQELVDKILILETKLATGHSDFESRLVTIQEAHVKEIEQIRNDASEQRDRLQEELLEQGEKLRAENEATSFERSSRAKQEHLEEVERLRLENSKLCADHEMTLTSLKDNHSREVEKLSQEAELARVEAETKNEKSRLVESVILESHTREKEELIASLEEMKSAIGALRNEHENHVNSLKQEHLESSKQLQQSTDDQVANFKLEVDRQTELARYHASLSEQATSERKSLDEIREKLESELINLRANHEENVVSITMEHEKQMEQIRKEADELVVRSKSEASNGNANLEALSKEAEDAAEAVNRLQVDLTMLRNELDESKNLLEQSSEREKLLLTRIAGLEAKTEADRCDFERRLVERQELTNKEIEETIAQLDLLEAEHNQEKASLERTIQDKDAIISALGAQLAEAQRRMTALEEAHVLHVRELESVKHDALMAQEETESLKTTVEHMKADHKKAMEAELAKRVKAQEQAREETIAEAESQFQRANDIYIQLKKEYDASCHKISKLEAEVKHARSEMEQTRNDQASKEMELGAELAQLKARKWSGR